MPAPKLLLIVTLWMGNLVPALDATLVGTALPTVIGDLGGLSLYGWVFAANLLTFTTAVPIFGKLADLYGRKPIFVGGLGVFLVGSILSGGVQSVEQLILCRAVAGVGLGASMPVAMTILGDVFSVEERARIQWIFGSAWFLASLVGPALGGIITIYASWRLVFYVTVPLGLASMLLLARGYREQVERRSHAIDFSGALLLAGGVTALLLALSPGGRGGAVEPGDGVPLLGAALLLGALFVWNEQRAREPILPLALFLNPMIGVSVLASLLSGVAQFGASSFLPLFAQGAQAGTAAHAGAVLAPMTVGWPIGVGIGGQVLLRIGLRRSVLLGMGLALASQAGFLLLERHSPLVLPMVAMFVLGLGFGFSSIAFMIAVQEAVDWGQRGVATASLQFARSIGGSVGVALMGALITAQMAPLLAGQGLSAGAGPASALLDPVARAALAPETLTQLQEALAGALRLVFAIMGAAALAGFGCALFFPGGGLLAVPASGRDEPAPAAAGPARPAGGSAASSAGPD